MICIYVLWFVYVSLGLRNEDWTCNFQPFFFSIVKNIHGLSFFTSMNMPECMILIGSLIVFSSKVGLER